MFSGDYTHMLDELSPQPLRDLCVDVGLRAAP